MKSKENLIPAKRTNPDSNYAYAQEMEEDSVQQVENCLEDATLLTLQKAGAAYKDRIARKRELHKPHQEGSLYRNTLEPREKKTVVREPSKTNPQGTSKQEQQRCTVQKQIEQQVKKVAREIRGVDIDQKQLRTAANTARKGKKAGQVTQRTQRMIYRAKQAAGESAEAAKKGIAVIKRTINRLARYEQDEGKHSTEIVFDTPKTQNARRTIPLTRSVIEDLKRWRSIQLADQNAAGAAYQDTGFVVTNELGMYFEQRTFKDYYNRMLQDAGIGHFTFHALRHTFATRALERGMDYKTLSAILGHYSVSFTMDTYVHSMDEHKRNEMDKMDDLFGISLEISVEQQPYPVLFTVTEEGCKAFAPDFPKIQIQAGTMETALMEAKKQIQKALSQFKYPPIPTRQEDIVVQENSVLILLKTA